MASYTCDFTGLSCVCLTPSSWKLKISLFFETQKLMKIVNGAEKLSHTNDVESIRIWKEKDAVARFCLVSTMGQLGHNVITIKMQRDGNLRMTSYEMWQELHKRYRSPDELEFVDEKSKFDDLYKSPPHKSVIKLISPMEDTVINLREAGERYEIDEKCFLQMIVDSLPEHFTSHFKASIWDGLPDSEKTMETLTARLLLEEKRIRYESKTGGRGNKNFS